MSLVPFQIPPHPGVISQIRDALPPEEFRIRLRKHLLDHPGLTLAQVAKELEMSRQYVGALVGKLNRPKHFAVKREQAKQKMVELRTRVAGGESAEHAVAAMGVSLTAARKLGLRVKSIRPAHGTQERAAVCDCWRCRRAAGAVVPRGTRMDAVRKAEIEDLLAWRDPDDDSRTLTQVEIGKLVGVGQAAVSRVARGAV